MAYILQCSSNTAFQGVFLRAIEAGLLDPVRHKEFEKGLAVSTCDAKGGICAFNGTGNSSRHLVAALGLVHPTVELLTDPPTTEQVNVVVVDLMTLVNKPEYGVAEIVIRNMANAVRLHSASGGSTNLMMHLVGAAIYAGYRFSIHDIDKIHHAAPIPDLFDYSLTQGRDIFALAKQCCSGDIRGMETLVYEMVRNDVPMDLDAPTVTGSTWRARLAGPDRPERHRRPGQPGHPAPRRAALSAASTSSRATSSTAPWSRSAACRRSRSTTSTSKSASSSSTKARRTPTTPSSMSICSLACAIPAPSPSRICRRSGSTTPPASGSRSPPATDWNTAPSSITWSRRAR